LTRNRVLRKTKVIGTLGPACDSKETLEAMVRAGMNVARLNFSHGSHAEHRVRLVRVREAAAALGENVGVMADTRGLEVRTGVIEGGAVELQTGQPFTLFSEEHLGDSAGVQISWADLAKDVSPGTAILIDDGSLELRVQEIRSGEVRCEVIRGGRLSDRKGVNIPGVVLRQNGLSEADQADLRFAVEHDVEYIAASFVRSASDVNEIRAFLAELGASTPIIAKIENKEGVENLEEILSVANGAMVARGDLGVELPIREVPIIQKRIIRTTVMNGKPVVTATQMLDSMERNATPTRAEVSDVANAILDGTSAVMLSGETAIGAYPVEAVRTMAELAVEAEASLTEYGHLQHILTGPANAVTEAVSQAAITVADHLDAAAILTLSESGFTARSISKHRPSCPIISITPSLEVVRRLSMNWGVTALHYQGERTDEAMFRFAIGRGREMGWLGAGDLVVATAGRNRQSGSTNMIRVIDVGP
jgi:pyruvate kinase